MRALLARMNASMAHFEAFVNADQAKFDASMACFNADQAKFDARVARFNADLGKQVG
jgi:hypothetical protein